MQGRSNFNNSSFLGRKLMLIDACPGENHDETMQSKQHLAPGSKESAKCIVSDLVRENATIVLDIQKQLVDDRVLVETLVGRYVQECQTNIGCRMPEAR
jgi:hypothetical protein